MRLNNLSHDLKNSDKSNTNGYLAHIVELLRKELESLQAEHDDLNEKFTAHDETQKIIVETKEVKADDIKSTKITTEEIEVSTIRNDDAYITLLNSAINLFGNAKLNGHNILTDESFTGPFIYKGKVEVLPETANIGEVYIYDDKVSIWNGTSYDTFAIPLGTVSRVEYDEDKAEIISSISEVKNDIEELDSDLNDYKEITDEAISTINEEVANLEINKVDEAPKDGNSYLRKDGDWIESSKAENTVKEVAGESIISNEESGVSISSPKISLTSEDIEVNGTSLVEANKFEIEKTNGTDDEVTWYERQFVRSPYSDISDVIPAIPFGYANRINAKAKNVQNFKVATRDYIYHKSASTSSGETANVTLTSTNKRGHTKEMQTPGNVFNYITPVQMSQSDLVVWNPQFAPDGLENAMYQVFFGVYRGGSTGEDKSAAIYCYDNGEYKQSFDLTAQLGDVFKSQTMQYMSDYWTMIPTGGKSLRNKNIQRLCFVAHNERYGGNFAVIVGGNKESSLSDPFDPSKAIFVKLPALAFGGPLNMAATDSAWYLTEDNTNRIMRISPTGNIVEYYLSGVYSSNFQNYIEYTDKNGRPACAYVLESTTAREVLFIEEGEDTVYTEREIDAGRYGGALWRFMENDYYVFFTSCFGYYGYADNSFDDAAKHKKLYYWDKATKTTHVINDLMETVADFTFGANISMVKTQGNAIWFVPVYSQYSAIQRTSAIKYLSNVDYTNIVDGVDTGAIQPQTVFLGTDYPWFEQWAANGFAPYSFCLESTASYAYSTMPVHLFAVNDDGILCIISPDCKAYALCYGDGNVRVFKNDVAGKTLTFNPNNQNLLAADTETTSFYSMVLFPAKHGWVLRYRTTKKLAVAGKTFNCAETYIGLVYKNGMPTILQVPHLSYSIYKQACSSVVGKTWDYYGYNLTYDDYERRKLVLRDVDKECAYTEIGEVHYGNDEVNIEVEHNGKDVLNLKYEGKTISSTDL